MWEKNLFQSGVQIDNQIKYSKTLGPISYFYLQNAYL